MAEFEPIRIVKIITEEVSKPRNDGTSGCALYNVPFQLSEYPPAEWADYFPHAWDHPSRWTSMHRPGICTIVGDRVWLNGTTLEEVAKTHKETLQLALDETNQRYVEFVRKRQSDLERRRTEEEKYKEHVRKAADSIKFD